jgi:NAD(P)-dependent dehydrogenase (short-subunit alcohol dehydrogenase family)
VGVCVCGDLGVSVLAILVDELRGVWTMERLAGKRALVTGSGTGIGREVALEFARQGADVVVHYAHSDSGARSAVDEITALGRRAMAVQAAFTDLDEVVALADQAIEFLGGLDCLVNNAGITLTKPFLATTREQFDTLFNVNIRAQYFLTQRVVEHMLESKAGGAICSITSIHGLQGAPEYSLYAATKGAIIAYTRTLAVELAYRGIRLNAIAPGWVTVENYAKAIPDYDPEDEKRAAEELIPAARAGAPLDIAQLAAFLCSDQAGFIVGQTIVSDGGSTALLSLKADFRAETNAHWGIGYVPGA